MNETKSPFASKTVLAALVGVFTGLATILQAFLAEPPDMNLAITGAVAVLSALGAIWGRYSANTRIE